MQICLKSQVGSCWEEKCFNLLKNQVDSISFRLERSQPLNACFTFCSPHGDPLVARLLLLLLLAGKEGDRLPGQHSLSGTADSLRNEGAGENQDQTP